MKPQTNILIVKRNDKLVWSNILRQYLFKACMGACDAWDAFLVKSGRIRNSDDTTG